MVGKFADELRRFSQTLRPGTGGRGRRSPLFRWMFERADMLEKVLRDQQPSWASVAETLAGLGLEDGEGKSPTGERARKTWFEVRRTKGWHLAPPRADSSPASSMAPHQSVPDAMPPGAPTPADTATRDRIRAQFKPVTVRK